MVGNHRVKTSRYPHACVSGQDHRECVCGCTCGGEVVPSSLPRAGESPRLSQTLPML